MEKGKISVRRELREPDAFMKATYKVLDYARDHRKMLTVVAILLAASLITFIGVYQYTSNRKAEAERALNRVLLSLERESEETGKLLEKIDKEYRNTAIAPVAYYLTANYKFRAGQLDEAANIYRDNQVDDRYLEDLQRMGLAVISFQEKKFDEAIAILEKMQAEQSFITEDTYILLALSYEKSEKPEKALATYENMLQLLPNSFLRPWAEERLISLKKQLKS